MVAKALAGVNDALDSHYARRVRAKLDFFREIQDMLTDLKNHVHELSGCDPTDREPAGFAVLAVGEVLCEVELLLLDGLAERADDRLDDVPARAAFGELLDAAALALTEDP
jgi:hypothetical protein